MKLLNLFLKITELGLNSVILAYEFSSIPMNHSL